MKTKNPKILQLSIEGFNVLPLGLRGIFELITIVQIDGVNGFTFTVNRIKNGQIIYRNL